MIIRIATVLTHTCMPMADPFLTLHQMFSPAFPTGGFAYSHGLEAMVAEGRVASVGDMEEWLETVLRFGAGATDAALFCCAYDAGDDLDEVAELAAALSGTEERRRETMLQGAAFAATMRKVWQLDLPDMAYPVAAGRAAALMGLPRIPSAEACLLGMASNLVHAGVRLIPLGQSDGQAVLAKAAVICSEVVAKTADTSIDDIGGFAPLIDISSARHEVLETRLFRS